jgi:hypothetical protein
MFSGENLPLSDAENMVVVQRYQDRRNIGSLFVEIFQNLFLVAPHDTVQKFLSKSDPETRRP